MIKMFLFSENRIIYAKMCNNMAESGRPKMIIQQDPRALHACS